MPSKRWRDLILCVWHVDPLRCPVCQSPMRVIAAIDDPRVSEKILRPVWQDEVAMAVNENRFSLTRVASKAAARQGSKFVSVS